MHSRIPSRRERSNEQGYILIVLMLFITVLAIAAAEVALSSTFQIQRDREEELIHRGVQYSRAVRRYVKKFGRYPMRVEELENTNNMRFLRKRYKDPVTGQDFKVLHLGEVQLAFGGGIAGATPVNGVNAVPGCRHWVEPLRYLGRKRNPPLPAVSQMPPKEPQAPRTRIKTLLCRTCRAGRATRSSQIQAHKRRG